MGIANDLTVGSPSKNIIRFTMPLLLSTAVQQLYNVADSAIVGKLDSTAALAAVGAAHPVTLIYVALGTGFAMGSTVYISTLFGAKKMKELKSAIYTVLIFMLAAGAFLGALGCVFAGPFLRLMQCNPDVFVNARTYVAIYAAGAFPMLVYNAVSSVFTGLGDAKRPLIFLIMSSVLNVILDIIAVGPMKLSVAGAAAATAISQLTAALVSSLVLLKRISGINTDGVRVRKFSPDDLKGVLKLSVPSIMQQCCVACGHSIIQSRVNTYSTGVIAGYEIGAKIVNFIYMCFNTMGTALSGFVGQNLGAGKKDRIRSGYRASCLICLITVCVVVLLVQIFAPWLIGIFINKAETDTADVYTTAMAFIRIVTIYQLIVSQIIPSGGLLRGAGKVNKFFIATIVDFGLRVIASFILPGVMGSVNGFFWAWYVGGVPDLIMLLIYCRNEFRRGVLKA